MQEAHGIVFAYLGPPDHQPPFPVYDSFIRPGYRVIRIGDGYLRSHWCAFQLAAPSVGTLPFTLTSRLLTMLAWAS